MATRTKRRPASTMYVVPEWVERHCVVPDGFRKGEPFALYDYQLVYLANFYLVRGDAKWVPENPVLAPAFVYRRGLLLGPQKVGKNPLVASQICVEAVGPALFGGWAGDDDGWVCAEHGCPCGWEYPYEPGEPMGMCWPTPLIQITAFSEESTENTYDALRPMIDAGPLHEIIPKTGEEFIRLPGGGRVDTVTASAQSRLGQRVTHCPQDELGLWTRRNKMLKVASTQWRGLAGMGGRASCTSNMFDPTERSVAQTEMHSKDRDIYRQCERPPKNLQYKRKADRAKIHRIVYPPDTWRENGGHVDLAGIESEAASLIGKGDLAEAARFYGNIEMPGGGHLVAPDVWTARTAGKRTVTTREPVACGFDGSLSDDATALIGCTADGHLFVPVHDGRPTIWLRPENAPDGWKIPRLEVKAAVRWFLSTYTVGLMLADPPKWQTEIEAWASEFGEERVVMFDTNQPKPMSRAVDRFTTGLGDDGITHDGTEILTDHVVAMVKKKAYVKEEDETDGRVRYTVTKPDDGRKIDAGVGALLAYEAAKTMPEIEAAAPVLAMVVRTK